jgi:hypothetical protein
MKRFVTRALIVMASILGIVFAQVPPASAQASDELASNLAALWTTVLETPASQNPFGKGGPQFACWDLDDSTVAPFAGGVEFSCKVKSDTKLFVAGFSTECSTFDNDCGREDDPPGCDGTTAPELLRCARELDSDKAPIVTLDGSPVSLTEVATSPLNIVLPKHNVFGEPKGTQGLSVAHGFVALLGPLAPGTHTIMIKDNNVPPTFPENTTTIVVTPGH